MVIWRACSARGCDAIVKQPRGTSALSDTEDITDDMKDVTTEDDTGKVSEKSASSYKNTPPDPTPSVQALIHPLAVTRRMHITAEASATHLLTRVKRRSSMRPLSPS